MTAAALIRDLAAIPGEYLPYDTPERRVLPVFGVDAPTLASWVDLGLRYRRGDTRIFSSTELHYLSLRTGNGGVHRRTIQSWAAAARAAGKARFRVDYFTPMIEGVAAGTEVEVLTPAGRRPAPFKPVAVIASFSVTTRGGGASAPACVRPLLTRVAGLDPVYVPQALRGSREFLNRTGFIDCEDEGTELLRLCAASRIEARPVYGLVLSMPVATTHACVQVRDGGNWITVSPLLLSTMHRFGGLAAAEVPHWSALDGMYFPLSSDPVPLATVDGTPIPVSPLVTPVDRAA